ncbi:MAG: hypothetical protein OXU26_04570 [Acidobacteriota bacterium]|nr:hypothetical protein [Acidobacteriota bacterium]MDE2963164.1 hypothetical protein [Acidobacteriota bacterium]
MDKRTILAVVAVFLAWSLLDIVIHQVVLMGEYGATIDLWRPPDEMMIGLIYVVTLISAVVFVGIYKFLICRKELGRAIQYGLLFGVAVGIGMGYGSYAVMPLTHTIALTWFLGTVVQGGVAGALLGLIVKE